MPTSTLGKLRLDPEAVLASSHGFLVDAVPDQHVGVVDDVLLDGEGLPHALVVACGWFGRRRVTVPVADVEAIWPRERRLRLRLRRSARVENGTSRS